MKVSPTAVLRGLGAGSGVVGVIIALLAWRLPVEQSKPAPPPVVNIELVNNNNDAVSAAMTPPPRQKKRTVAEVEPPPRTQPQRDERSDYLRSNLEPLTAGASRWSVLVFGDQRAGDVAMSLTDALSNHGKETVVLFRDERVERGVAPDLFRGNSSLLARLDVARYCDHLLVGRVQTSFLGAMEGLIVVRAVLSVRLLDGNGRVMGNFEVMEKGGGHTEEAATENAIVALRNAVPARISEAL